MLMEIGRLNARIPSEELKAFRVWCVAHEMTMSRVLTGLIHQFNARQRKLDEQATEKLRRGIEANAHAAVQQWHATANALKKQAAAELPLPIPELGE